MQVDAHLGTLTNIAILVMALAQLLLIAAIAFFAFRLKVIVADAVESALDKTLPRVQPVLDNVTQVTGQVSDIVQRVAPHVERIAAESEGTVHSVSTKVKTTSSLVTENVARPVVNIASLLTGVQKGLEVWKSAKKYQDGSNGTSADSHSAETRA